MAKRILIIDDDKEFCEELAEILKEAGFDTDYVFDPLVGKVLFQENAYDVLLLDYKMPRLNGIDFLKEFKGKTGPCRIFFITGSLTLPSLLEENGLSPLVADIINKPFEVKTLLEKLR